MENEKVDAPPVPKSRFKPKIPVCKRRASAVEVAKPETKVEIIDKELLAKLNSAKVENRFTRKLKPGQKSSPVKIAFGHGRASTITKFGHPKNEVTESNREDDGLTIPQAHSVQKEYVDPWDYEKSTYPITLPLRQPNSGDPEILDRKEFGDDPKDEETKKIVTPAEELGLMNASNKPELLFFQLPQVLPFIEPAYDKKCVKMEFAKANNEGKGILPEATKRSDDKLNNAHSLNHLPSGRLGKMIVYKSGKIKMKIGDMLFDVSPGQNCAFAQDVAAISVKEKKCSVINNITKQAIVTPDVDVLLESISKI